MKIFALPSMKMNIYLFDKQYFKQDTGIAGDVNPPLAFHGLIHSNRSFQYTDRVSMIFKV